MSDKTDLCYMSAMELAEAIRRKAVSPVEVVEAVIGRIAQLNPVLNAFATISTEYARERARQAEVAVMRGDPLGPLHGVPVSVKDLISTNGIRTTRGSKRYEWVVPKEDAPAVQRLNKAGAVMIGKTTTPELGWKATTVSPVTGVTRNPWDTDKTPGGSSGGAAAAVAAGLGPLALGTDGGGSIRVPASFSGLFGLKPSHGRVAYYPPSAVESLAHAGPITRTVPDAALMLNVIAGQDERDCGSLPDTEIDYLAALESDPARWSVAWSLDLGYAQVDPEVARITADAVKVFEQLGCRIDTVELDLEDPVDIFTTLWLGGLWTALKDDLAVWADRMDTDLVHFLQQGRQLTMEDYVDATFRRTHFWSLVRPTFQQYDILLTPTVAIPAFDAERLTPGMVPDTGVPWAGWTPFTYPFNLTGQPAATVPCGWTASGLPVGLQIVGRRYDEVTVLRAAAAFEEARPWQERRPSLSF
jgi:aspartyl-tRNA(Asn)/glutamyl-tRNA(Gln) amidotransferase subunit A